MQIGGPLLLVGCGKMGGALLDGWLDGGVAPADVTVIEPQEAIAAALAAKGPSVYGDVAEIGGGYKPAVVVLAIKPQQMDGALSALRRFAGPETVYLSIAAGKTLAYFEAALGPEAVLVRAMPNTPAAVGRGITVLTANPRAGGGQRQVCEDLLTAVGEVDWVEEEALLDPVTAVSGGGPAYVFLLIEVLARAGVEAGLPEDLAMRLARTTVAGAGELVHQAPEPASTLRENVTSPGGTTLEALNVLMAPDGLQPLMTRAIAAATKRSRELAS